MFGLSVGLPSARRFARQRHLAAIPASMQASDEPMAEAPTVLAASGAFHRSASMCTQRDSISAVCGYSSLSIMFLLTDSAIRARTSGSTHVWQNVARFCRALPSSMQLVRHQLVRIPRQRLVRREPVLRHRPGQVVPGEHAVLQLLADGLALVQWHGRHLLDGERSRCRYPPDDRCVMHPGSSGRGRAGDVDGGRSVWHRHHPVWGIWLRIWAERPAVGGCRSRSRRRSQRRHARGGEALKGSAALRTGRRWSSRPATARPVLAPISDPVTVSPG